MNILRTVLAIVVGWMVSSFVIAGIQMISFAMYRPDDGKSMLEQVKAIKEDKEYARTFIRATPTGGLIMVLIAWESGAFVGGLVSALIAGRARVVHAAVIGALVLAGTVVNAINLKADYDFGHPDWMLMLGLLLPLPMSMAAGKIVARRLGPHQAPTAPDGAVKEGAPPARPG
jgi:hypothetical protein